MALEAKMHFALQMLFLVTSNIISTTRMNSCLNHESSGRTDTVSNFLSLIGSFHSSSEVYLSSGQ